MTARADEASQRALRAFVAFWAHAPGLWLCWRATLGPVSKRQNLVAIALTVAAMIATWLSTGQGTHVLAAWALGHMCWGTWLAVRVYREMEGR